MKWLKTQLCRIQKVVTRTFINEIGRFKLCAEHVLNVYLGFLHAPKSDLIVYYVDQDNKLASQNYEINIANVYQNNIDMKFNKNASEPGEIVTLNIKSEPNSFVFVCVIDKSIEILGKPLFPHITLLGTKPVRFKASVLRHKMQAYIQRLVEVHQQHWLITSAHIRL